MQRYIYIPHILIYLKKLLCTKFVAFDIINICIASVNFNNTEKLVVCCYCNRGQ